MGFNFKNLNNNYHHSHGKPQRLDPNFSRNLSNLLLLVNSVSYPMYLNRTLVSHYQNLEFLPGNQQRFLNHTTFPDFKHNDSSFVLDIADRIVLNSGFNTFFISNVCTSTRYGNNENKIFFFCPFIVSIQDLPSSFSDNFQSRVRITLGQGTRRSLAPKKS